MRAGPFFDYRNGAANSALASKKRSNMTVVCEIGDIDRGFHVANKPMLGDSQEGRYP